MRQNLRRFRKLSDGERARALAFSLVGFSSGVLGYLAVLHLDGAALFEPLSGYQKWIICASVIGGLTALFLSGDKMGQDGLHGILRGLAGALWVTFIGALIGGTLALPLYGTMFGPFIVTVTLLGAPMLAALWFCNMVGVHILLGIYQRERDSIFTVDRMTIPDHPDSLSMRMRRRHI